MGGPFVLVGTLIGNTGIALSAEIGADTAADHAEVSSAAIFHQCLIYDFHFTENLNVVHIYIKWRITIHLI